MDNVVSFPVTPAIHNRRVMANPAVEIDPHFEYIEAFELADVLITGCAKIEPLGHGLVRLWLYGTEDLSEKVKVVRAKIVVPQELAKKLAAELNTALS